MQTERVSKERRARPRTNVMLSASIKVANGGNLMCTVMNVSPMGALIVFSGATLVPENFKLSIPECFFEAECRVRHRSADRVGVLFETNRREALARFS